MTTHNDAVCGCPDFRTSRRTFLKGVGAVAGAGVFTSLAGDVFTKRTAAHPRVAASWWC